MFIIKYDFVLTEDITLGAGCVLCFEGGSITDSGENANTIKGQNTSIAAPIKKIFSTGLQFVGSWAVNEVYPEWFGGGIGGDDTTAINAALNFKNYYDPINWPESPSFPNVKLADYAAYTISEPITMPQYSAARRIYSANGKTVIYCTHTGDAFRITRPLTSRGRISFENFCIYGVDYAEQYHAISTRTSTGSGFVLSSSSISLKDIVVSGFESAVVIHTGHNNTFDRCLFTAGKYGVVFDDATANFNIFNDCIIRDNYANGIRITTNYAIFNQFNNCEIESNQPYLADDLTNDNGIGVCLSNAYNTVFNACYFEKSNTAFVYLHNGSRMNTFSKCKFDDNNHYTSGKQCPSVKFGSDARNNIFSMCVNTTIGHSDYTPLVVLDVTSYSALSSNIFEECLGLYIDRTLLNDYNCPKFVKCRTNSSYGGTTYQRPTFGEGINFLGATMETDQPYIDGIGTNNATLYVKGYGMVAVGNVASATTITGIEGLKKGEIVLISSYGSDGSLTLALPRMKTPLVFNKVNQNIVICRDSFDDIIELSRNEM